MKWLYIALLLLGVLLIGGCSMPTPCAPAEMGIAGNLSPSNYALVSLSPSLTWEYPPSVPVLYPYPSGSSDCAINGYQVYLAPFYDQYNNLGGNVLGSTSTSFTPSGALTPATLYFWEVRALSASGPGPWTGKHAFVTGPVCDLSSLEEPYAYAPTGTIHTLSPAFIFWGDSAHDSSCMPTGYRLEVSEDPSFATTVASVDTTVSPSYSWEGWTPDSDLDDCTNYYWRVAAKNGSAVGPYANRSFRTQVGICPLTFIFIPEIDLNCRIGPNPLYNRLAILKPGESLPVLARHLTAGEPWYNVQLPDDTLCWALGNGEFIGDPNELPESDDFPPLPEDKPDQPGEDRPNCSGLSQQVCTATPGCSYNIRTKSCVAN